MNDRTGDFVRTCDDLRNHEETTILTLAPITGHFDESEGVVEVRCTLKELSHLFHTLTNSIADDEQ